MRKFLLSLLAVFIVALSVRAEITIVLHEGFENDTVLPPGWKDTVIQHQSPVDRNWCHWQVETTTTDVPQSMVEGVARAGIRRKSASKCVTQLITPVMNCSGLNEPRLIFAHAQPQKNTAQYQDSLKVKYRTSPDDTNWKLLKVYTNNMPFWQYDTLDLIEPNNTYQIAFEAYIQNGSGIVLDDITIASTPQCSDVQSIGVVAMANSAAITIGADLSIPSFQVAVTTAAVTDWNSFDPNQAVYYNPNVSKYDAGDLTIPNLQSQTDYYVYARAACADMESGYTAWVDTTFRTALGFPMTEEFANRMPAGWSCKQGTIGGVLSDYTGSDGWQYSSTTSFTGSSHALCKATDSGPYWLVSPGIDLVNVPNETAIEMTFKLILDDYNNGTAVSTSNLDRLQFTVLISENDGASWEAGNATIWSTSELANYPISQINNQLKSVRINMNRYKGKTVRLAFVGQTTSSYYYFHVDDVSIHSYDVQCGDVQKVTAMPAVNSITATWEIFGKENAKLQIAKSADFTTDVDSVMITSGKSYTFTNLTQNTQYYIRVKQDCAGAEWVSTSCRTAVGLPYLNPFVGTTMPQDWTRHTGVSMEDVLNGQNLPAAGTSGWANSTTYSAYYPGMSDLCMYADMSETNRFWLVSPTILMNDSSNSPLRLSFLLAASKKQSPATAPVFSDTDDKFAVLISEDAGRSWTEANATIWDCDTLSNNQKLNTFSEVPQRVSVEMTNYRGKAVKIALYAGSTVAGAKNYIFIDNLSVNTYDANCGGVRNLDVNVSSTAATVNWTAVGTQTVKVQLSKNSNFTPLVDSLTTQGSTKMYNNLTPHTLYYVRVRQTCSTDDADWATASFTTPYGVPFVETFTASDVPADWEQRFGVADSVMAGTEPLTTSTSSRRTWTKGSTSGTMYLNMYTYESSYSSSYYCKSWLITPNLDMSGAGQNAQLSFNLAVSGSSTSMTTATATANDNTFIVLGSTDDGATWFILRDWRNSGSGTDRFSDIPNQLTRTVINLSQYTSGNLRLAFYGGTMSGNTNLYVHINNVQVKSYDANCQGISSVRVNQITSDGVTIQWVAGGTQSADVIIATDAAFAHVVDSMTVGGDAVVTGLASNTKYYVKARQSCDTQGEWMFVDFKTLCSAVTPEAFGEEGFDNAGNMDCWTFGSMDAGTAGSTSSGRKSETSFGNVLRLAKTSTSETTANRPYAVTPELDVDSINHYQVIFDACTNNTDAKNIACLNVGVVADPNDMGSIEHIKTMNLNYASDSTQMNTYVVSFADYTGDMDERFGRYIVFSAANAPSDTTNYILIDNVSVSATDGCQQLVETSIDSVSYNAARMVWEDAGSTQYEVLVSMFGSRAVDTIPDSSIVFRSMTQTHSILIDSLEGNTRYYAYVRSVCVDNNETTYSRWSSALAFKTMCTFISQYPWTEDFENMTTNAEPECWDKLGAGTVQVQTSDVHAGSKSLKFSGSTSNVIALPPFDVEINTLQITLYTRPEGTYASAGNFDVGYLTDPLDESTFNAIETWSYSEFSDAYQEKEVVLVSAPAGARLAFRHRPSSTSYYWFVDDIRVEALPSCVKPLRIETPKVTSDSVTLTWVAGSSATSFEYVLMAAGDSVDWSSAAVVNQPTVTLTGLSANTPYDFYVRANCDSTDQSEPCMASFRTACSLTALPFMETFDALTSGIPACWDNSEGTTTSDSYKWSSYATGYEGKCVRFDSYNNSSGKTNVLATPAINLTVAAQLTFMWMNPAGGAGEVLISTDGGTTRDTLLNDLTGISTWTEKTVNLSAYTGQTVNIYFHGTSNWGYGDAYLYLDNVLVEAINSCSKPITVAASDPTEDGATLTWTADSTVTSFEYAIVESGGTVNWSDSVVVNGRSVTLTGLNANTIYDFYVRSSCGATDKSGPRMTTFRTACPAMMAVPFVENFDALSSGIPACWDNSEGTTTSDSYKWSSYATGYEGRCVRFDSYNNSSGKTNVLATPAINLTVAAQLTFMWMNPAGGAGEVFISTDGGTNKTSLYNALTGIANWTEVTINLSDYTNQTVNLYFKGTSNYDYGDAYLYLDNVTIDAIPACVKPKDVVVSGVLEDQATITWNSENTLFTLQYGTDANFDSLYTTVSVSENTKVLSGLTPQTTYYVRVQTNCGSDGVSVWSDVMSFATSAVPTIVGNSWSDNFEAASCTWDLINGTSSNKWAWGTAAHNGGTHGLYVSNNNGTSNAYTNTDDAMIYATKLLSLEAGKYEFSYDWLAKGESSYDYLRVALVPSSVTLTAGTSTPTGFSTSTLPAGWIALDGGSKLNESTEWQRETAVITLATAGNYYMVLAWYNDYTTGDNPPAAIDNVAISQVACAFNVDSVKVSGITLDSATVKWKGGGATQWQVSYSTKSSFENATDSIVSDSTFYMSGLTAATAYYVKVRAYCGGTDFGSWSDVVAFVTDCEAVALPYSENFDNLDASVLNCWSVIKYSSYPYVGTTTSSAHSGSNYLYFYGGTSSSEQIAILPEMQYPAYMLKVAFYSRTSYTSSGYGNLIVGVMSDPNDASTFIEADQVPNCTTYTYVEQTLTEMPATHRYVAIKLAGGSSYNSQSAYLDDLTVSLAVDPMADIFKMEVGKVTNKSVELMLSVNPDSARCHNYELVVCDTACVDSVLNTMPKIQMGSATNYTVTGLKREKAYYFYVRSACDSIVGRWFSAQATTKGLIDCDQIWTGGTSATSNTNLPTTSYYKYGISQQIFTPAEIGMPGDISAITFNSTGSTKTRDIEIYLVHTTKTTFASSTDWDPATDAVKVYGGSVDFTAGEEITLTFDNPYHYDGVRNLLLMVDDNTGSWSSGLGCASYMARDTQAIYVQSDGTDYEVESVTTYTASSRTRSKNNVRFDICNLIVPCPAVTDLRATAVGRGVTTFDLNWTASEADNLIDYDVYVGTVNPATLDSVPETYRHRTDTALSLTNLTPATHYYAAVRANCNEDDGVSTWAIVEFTTYATCPKVEDLTVEQVSKTAVKATWEFGGPELDTAFIYVLATDSVDWETVVPDTVNALTLNLTNLLLGQQYTLYVAQDCATENSEYAEVTFTTPAACAPVENLTYEATHSTITLTWSSAAFGAEEAWEAVLSNGTTQIVTERKAIFYGLPAEANYTAYVRAICSESEMSDSVPVRVSTTPEPEPCVTVTEGTESTSSYLPTYTYYNYSLTEQIYTAAEIGQAGDILSLTFTNTSSSAQTRDITIYMAHTTKNAFASSSDWVTVSTSDQVYTGQVTFSANDEVTLTLNRPFNYNGRDNLLLVVDDNTGTYISSMSFKSFTASATQAIYAYSDGTDYSPLAPSASGTTSTSKNKVRFCFNYQAGACVGATRVTVSDVTVQSATVSWMPGGHEVEWNTVLSAVALSDSALVAEMDTVQALSQSFTGLSDDTDYHFYIRSSCDSANVSGWQEVVFTTTAMCLVPVNLSVDSVTSTSAYLSWGDVNEGYDAPTYQVAYGLAGVFDLTIPATYQVVPTTDTTLVLNNLSANTLYCYAVSIECDATYTSRWSTPVQARTGCGVVTEFPWTEDFEPYSNGTLNIPCWSNEQIVAGTGSGSTGLLFQIAGTTMNGNDTKKLCLPDMRAGTKTMLTLPEMYIDEANEYEFDIDVLRNATSYATEGLRIYVSTDDSLANATELAFISRNYSVADSVHGIPAESESGWYTYELNIPIADTLYIIVVGESQYGQATYADNFRVRRQPTCKRPVIVKTEATDNAIELTWTGGIDREYRVECDTLRNFSTARTLTVTNDTTVRVTGLTPVTQYWFRVKGICGDSAVSDYSSAVSAKTLYVLPFSENFSSSTIPADWNRLKGNVTDSTEVVTSGWSFTSSSSNYYAYSSVWSSTTTNARYTLVTPGIVMNTTEPGIQLSFEMSLGNSSTGTTAPSATVSAGREFSVVVSTDNGATWTKVQSWIDSAYAAIPASARSYKVDLTNYASQAVLVGFYHSVGTSTSTSSSYIRLDNVRINGYNSACAGIDNLTVTNPGTVGAVVTWEYVGQGAPDAVVAVSTEASPDSAYIWSDTVRNNTTVTLPTMPMSSTIHVFVKQICGEGESEWAEAMFDTPIGVPYHPTFPTATLPNGWTRSTTTATAVFGGTAMERSSGDSYSDFKYTSGDVVMNYGHFKSNVYGTSCHHWLVTPQIDMTPNVGQGVMLSFDLSLCDYGNPGQTADAVGSDDQFMVVVSEDGGNTWSRANATVWQDAAGADYSYTAIPSATAETYRIDLSRYTGKVIRIGFYAESTVSGGDNDLHLGNIHVEQVSANMYSDTICSGQSYQNYGFTILANQCHEGTNSFSKYTPATETVPATLDVLTLEVLSISDTTIYATVCEGAAYTYDENVYVEEGLVVAGEQTITFFLTSMHGCDSIVNLHITGLASADTIEYAETCNGIPYNWHGQALYLTGTYVDTLQTIEGCDSICTLLLTVEDVISRDTAVTLCYGEQIIINGQVITKSGVYTESIDNPEGCDEEVVWYVTAVGKLESHKRVVVCKGETYSDDQIHGLTTEYHGSTTTTSKVSGCDSTVIYDIWFAAAGETLYVSVPKNELPFYVNGLELIAAGTAEGEYTKTVATNCGDVVMVITVGEAVERYTITVKAENGLPYGGGIYVAGEQVEIGVTPLNGYKFDKWNDGNTENPRTITVSADVTYTGTCVEIEEGLEDVIREMGEDEVLKLIENQQLIIIRNGVRYNAQGAVIE